MTITIYGAGCTRCALAEAVIRRVVAECGADVIIEKVSDIQAIVEAGVLSTPAIAIDGVITLAGRIPAETDVRAWINR